MQNAFMKSKPYCAGDSENIPLNAHPPISLDLFMRQSGLSPATCWRYRKRKWLTTILIANRHYVTREAIVEFNRRASEGEFAGTLPNPAKARANARIDRQIQNYRRGANSLSSGVELGGNEQ
jgi:hypothetical protein